MMALMLTMGLVSCKDKAPAEASAENGVQAESQTGVEAEDTQKFDALSLTDLVEKAKAEAANWSVDQWKDALRSAMLNLKPIMEEVLNLQKSMEDDPAKALEFLGKMQEKQKDYEAMETLMNDLEKVAQSTENGKKVIEDEEWGKQLMEEIGLPSDLDD